MENNHPFLLTGVKKRSHKLLSDCRKFTYEFLSGNRSNKWLELSAISLMIAIEREKGNIHDYEIQVQNKGAVFPYAALLALAETCDEGAQKYGIHNWLLGMQVSSVLLNHGLNHIFKYQAGDTSENHLGHALWGYMTSIHMYRKRKDMCIELLDPDYVQTPAIVQLNKEIRENITEK